LIADQELPNGTYFIRVQHRDRNIEWRAHRDGTESAYHFGMGNQRLVGYDWAPFGVDLATLDHEEPERFAADAGDYVWEQGAAVIAEALVNGKEPLVTAEHALHVLEVIEAARESGATGKRIPMKSKFKWPVI